MLYLFILQTSTCLSNPERLMYLQLQDISCGGEHKFQDGFREVYYSIYCLEVFGSTTSSPSSTTSSVTSGSTSSTSTTSTISTTTMITTTTSDGSTSDAAVGLLQDILSSVVKTNVTGIVIVGLMIMVIILVVVLTIWVVIFVQNYEHGPNSRFYRRKSESTPKSPILSGGTMVPKASTER